MTMTCRAYIALLLALIAGCTAWAQPSQTTQSYDLCARGVNNDPAQLFSKTLHVRVSLEGPALEASIRDSVIERLIQDTVWKDRASKVFVQDFDRTDCAASGDDVAEISLAITQADVEAIRRAVGRGVLDKIADLAGRANLRLSGPPSSDSRKQWLRVYYSTNRQPTQKPETANAFGIDRVDMLSYGSVEVAVLHQTAMRDLENPSIFKFESATSIDDFAVAGKLNVLAHDQWLEELKRRAARFEQPGVLLFIHGYNVSFVDAARRAAQLSYDLVFPGPTVFFAWPSDASVIKYPRDGRDAENSWGAAASVLSDLTGLLPNGPVYIVAHSMGNRVMLGGLTKLLQDAPARRRTIREIVMAAPDVDQDSFRLNIAPNVLNTGPRFTLYASEHDLALGTSEFLHGGNRLGIGGTSLFVIKGVDSIDASSVTKEFFALNHSYFGDKSVVLSDIFFVIREAMPPDKRPHLRPRTGTPPAWELK